MVMFEEVWAGSLIFWEIMALSLAVLLQICVFAFVGVIIWELCKWAYFKIRAMTKKEKENE